MKNRVTLILKLKLQVTVLPGKLNVATIFSAEVGVGEGVGVGVGSKVGIGVTVEVGFCVGVTVGDCVGVIEMVLVGVGVGAITCSPLLFWAFGVPCILLPS